MDGNWRWWLTQALVGWQYKLVLYHGTDLGELFDLEKDLREFRNLWDDPVHAATRFRLTRQSFDAMAASLDLGPPITGAY